MFTQNVTVDMDTDIFVDKKNSEAILHMFKSNRGSLLFLVMVTSKTIPNAGI